MSDDTLPLAPDFLDPLTPGEHRGAMVVLRRLNTDEQLAWARTAIEILKATPVHERFAVYAQLVRERPPMQRRK